LFISIFHFLRAASSEERVLETFHEYATVSRFLCNTRRQSQLTYAQDKKSGFAREGAAIGMKALCQRLGPAALPLLLSSLPDLFELQSDKGEVVRAAAGTAIKSLISLTPVEAIEPVMQILSANLKTMSKWMGKVGCLKAMSILVEGKGEEEKEEIANMLGVLLPLVEGAMHDTKKEVCISQLHFRGT
jgi:elongation factor 3